MQHIQLLSTLWLSGFFMYPSDHYFLWKHLKRRRREGRKRTHRGRMGRRESNRALFSFKNLGMVSSWSMIFTILITTLKSFSQRRLQQSIYQCLNKQKCPVHSEVSRKNPSPDDFVRQVPGIAFSRHLALTFVYNKVLSKNGRIGCLAMWLFFKFYGVLFAKFSGNSNSWKKNPLHYFSPTSIW